MKRLLGTVSLALLALLLQACSSSSTPDSQRSAYDHRDSTDQYSQRPFSTSTDYAAQPSDSRDYDVPDEQAQPSYHFSNRRSPQAHKERDLEWIQQQSPSEYTIEMGTDSDRANVAKRLHHGPKSKRAAQFGHQRGEQKVYTGVYGTYKNREDAQQAMDKLPADLRNSAKIKQWQKVQAKTAKASPSATVPSGPPPTIHIKPSLTTEPATR